MRERNSLWKKYASLLVTSVSSPCQNKTGSKSPGAKNTFSQIMVTKRFLKSCFNPVLIPMGVGILSEKYLTRVGHRGLNQTGMKINIAETIWKVFFLNSNFIQLPN